MVLTRMLNNVISTVKMCSRNNAEPSSGRMYLNYVKEDQEGLYNFLLRIKGSGQAQQLKHTISNDLVRAFTKHDIVVDVPLNKVLRDYEIQTFLHIHLGYTTLLLTSLAILPKKFITHIWKNAARLGRNRERG